MKAMTSREPRRPSPAAGRLRSCAPVLLWGLCAILPTLSACAHNEGPPPAMLTGETMPSLIDNRGGGAALATTAPPSEAPETSARSIEVAPRPAHRPPPRSAPPAETSPPRAPAAGRSPAAELVAKDRVSYAGARGTIRRQELLTVLDRSPAAFLRSVESEPHIEARRFRGWRIVSFFASDPRFGDIDLRSGDVVTRINGRTIEQPDHFFVVWQELRAARELRVDLLRNGKPHVSRWDIVD